jgi:hypothetical protein
VLVPGILGLVGVLSQAVIVAATVAAKRNVAAANHRAVPIVSSTGLMRETS